MLYFNLAVNGRLIEQIDYKQYNNVIIVLSTLELILGGK